MNLKLLALLVLVCSLASAAGMLEIQIENPYASPIYNSTFKIIINSSYATLYAIDCSDLNLTDTANNTMQFGYFVCKQNMSSMGGTSNETHILVWNSTWAPGNTTLYLYNNSYSATWWAAHKSLSAPNNITLIFEDAMDGAINSTTASSAWAISTFPIITGQTYGVAGGKSVYKNSTTAPEELEFNFTHLASGSSASTNLTVEFFMRINNSIECGPAFELKNSTTLIRYAHSGPDTGGCGLATGWSYLNTGYVTYATGPPAFGYNLTHHYTMRFSANTSQSRLIENNTVYGQVTPNAGHAAKLVFTQTASGKAYGIYFAQIVAYPSIGDANYTVYVSNYTAPSTETINASLISPANNSNHSAVPVTLTWNCSGSQSASFLANVSVGGVVVSSNIVSLNNTATTYDATVAYGSYNWSVTCWNGTASNTTGNWTFNVLPLISVLNIVPAISPGYETANATLNINLTGNFNITSYNISVIYNNTLILNKTVTGVNSYLIIETANATAPLVDANSTAINFNITVASLMGGNQTDNTTASTHTVYLWYIPAMYSMAAPASTIEAGSQLVITQPAAPGSSYANVSAAYAYSLPFCYEFEANGSSANTTCTNRTLSTLNMTHINLSSAHLYRDRLIFADVYVLQSYNLTFNFTTESYSKKSIAGVTNATREYYVWFVNKTNGTINGTLAAANTTTVYNITFYDENDPTVNLGIDSAVDTFTVTFPDGFTKSYLISESATQNLTNLSIRAYPNSYTANVSSAEVYSRTNYTTRSRFLIYSNTSLSTTQNVSVYLLPNALATYAIINVVRNGAPVSGAYIQILKYYDDAASYIVIDQKITNANGQAPIYAQIDSFYKFIVYDTTGAQAYASTTPMQFICISGACSITITLSSLQAIDFIGTSAVGNCYGVNATNSIVFTYSDITGLTKNVTFLVWRSTNTTTYAPPVYNATFSASSVSAIYTLAAPENLSTYAYVCQIRYSASPESILTTLMIDFRWVATAIHDWLFMIVFAVMGLGCAGINPVLGIAISTIGLTILVLTGFIPLPLTVPIYLLIVGAVIIKFMLPKEGN